MVVSPVKTAEPIEMPFRLRTWVGPRNHVLDEVHIPMGRGSFEGGRNTLRLAVQKTAEPIEMLFRLWAWMGQRKHVLNGGAHWRHLADNTEPSMHSSDAACCQITLTTCFNRVNRSDEFFLLTR